MPLLLLQMNNYPCCHWPTQTMGMTEHTDSTLLTGSIQGLQIKRSDSMWIIVPAIPNAFFINVGYLLQVTLARPLNISIKAVGNNKYPIGFKF